MLNSSHIDFLISLEQKNYCWRTISASKQRKILELVTHSLVQSLGDDMYGITDTGQKAVDRLVSCINNDLGTAP